MMPDTTAKTGDMTPMMKQVHMKARKKKKYTQTAVEKAAAKSKASY